MAAVRDADVDAGQDESVKQLQSNAMLFLETGIEAMEQARSVDSPVSEQLIAAKLTLAQIYGHDGRFSDAVDVLENGPTSVLRAVVVDEGQSRPAQECKVKSSRLTLIVWRCVLMWEKVRWIRLKRF